MQFRLAHTFLVVALAGCAAPPTTRSGFLKDYAALRPGTFENVLIYKAPGYELQRFAGVNVTPARYEGTSKGWQELEPALREEILRHVDSEIASHIRQAPVPGDSRPMLNLRAAITDVEMPNRMLNMATTLLLGPLTRGGAALEVELADANTGQVLLALTCAERGHVLWDSLDAYTLLGHARIAVTECIRRFEAAYQAKT